MRRPSLTAIPADSWPRCCRAYRPKYASLATSSSGDQAPNTPQASRGGWSAESRSSVSRPSGLITWPVYGTSGGAKRSRGHADTVSSARPLPRGLAPEVAARSQTALSALQLYSYLSDCSGAGDDTEGRADTRQGRAGQQGDRVADGRRAAIARGLRLVQREEVEGHAGARDAADVRASRLGEARPGEGRLRGADRQVDATEVQRLDGRGVEGLVE